MEELEKALSNIVGLHDLKVQLRKWAKGMLLDERRRALGLKLGVRRPPHMAFLGNPGTGKYVFPGLKELDIASSTSSNLKGTVLVLNVLQVRLW